MEVFMATLTPAPLTGSSTNAILDPTILFFQQQKADLFEQTEKNCQMMHTAWEKEFGDLEQVQVDVRNRGSDLQHLKATNPGKEALEVERESYLIKYWAFKGTCEKIGLYGYELFKTITFFTPQPRNYYEEARLKSEQPELLDQIKKHEEICKAHIVKLDEFSKKISALQFKYVNYITSELNWSLQRFCQIVDQEGKPLSLLTRGLDNITTPVIPRPKGTMSVLSRSSSAVEKRMESASAPSPVGSSSSTTTAQPLTQPVKSESSSATTPLQSQVQIVNSNPTTPLTQPEPVKSETSNSNAQTPQSQPEPVKSEVQSLSAATPQPQTETPNSEVQSLSAATPQAKPETLKSEPSNSNAQTPQPQPVKSEVQSLSAATPRIQPEAPKSEATSAAAGTPKPQVHDVKKNDKST